MVETITEIEAILIACMPALTSILAVISAVLGFLNKFKKLAESIKENESLKAERDALKEEVRLSNEALKNAGNELRKTRKQIQFAVENISKIKYEDMTGVKNDEDLQD